MDRAATSNYLAETRAPRYSLLFALPLLLLYEGLAWVIAGEAGVRNGADVLLKRLFLLLGGVHGLTAFAVVIGGAWIGLIARDWYRRGRPRSGFFGLMLAESLVYAVAFGGVTSAITSLILRGPAMLAIGQGMALDLPTRIMVSLGAGIYEELLFRVVVVAALARLAGSVFHWRPWAAGTFATVLGAAIFSASHYVGPLGDAFEIASFTYRTVGGLLLSALYLLRGFGIAAWTHALYDILLTLYTG